MKRTLAGIGLLVVAGMAGAQSGPGTGGAPPGTGQPTHPGGPGVIMPPGGTPRKSAFEEALELALRSNPDLRVAAARHAEAEAELSRARLQVIHKVATAYQGVEAARAGVEVATSQLRRMGQLHDSKAVAQEEVTAAANTLAQARAKLAAAEAELTYLQGKGGRKGDEGAASPTGGMIRSFNYMNMGKYRATNVHPDPVKTDSSEKMRTALGKKVGELKSDGTPGELLDFIKTKSGINVHADRKAGVWKEKISMEFKDVTVAGLLQFLEDVLPGQRIVVRDYGLLIVPEEKVPDRATTLQAFLHSGAAARPAAVEVEGSGLKSSKIEGKIKRVDGNLCTITLGSDAGLAKGTVFEVFRLTPEPRYVGQVRVVTVRPGESLCERVGRPAQTLKVDDLIRLGSEARPK